MDKNTEWERLSLCAERDSRRYPEREAGGNG